MVLKKRLDYGFSGYRAPIIPRAPRSVRRRGSQKKAEVDGQICAFELLAAVAGKLLQESASSASSNAGGGKYQLGVLKDGVKQEQLEEDKALKCERLDLGSCAESNFVSELRGQERNVKSTLQEFIRMDSDSLVGRSSINTNSDFSKKVGSDAKSEICENKDAVGSFPAKIENEIGSHLEVDEKQTIVLATDICVNTRAFINSDSSVQLTSYRDRVPNTYFPRRRNDVKVGIRDDDENSARCNQPSTKIRAFRPQSRIGYRRIRKLLASKYWKVAPKLKDCEVSNTNGGRKAVYCNRRSFHTYERCQHEAPSKRRKLCGHGSTAAYDREASTGSISNIPEKGTKAEKSVSAAIFDRANRVSSSVVSRQESFQSRDSHVKFSIKSFKVPELYIEVPQSSTVGSLKRTVMEAVTAILSGELHVGVLLQGKKVRDDNKTLLQTGISHNGDLDSLGFTLESSSAQASSLFPDDPPVLLPCEALQQLIRSPASPIMDSGFTNESFDAPPLTKLDHHIESNHELVPSSTAISTEETVLDSRALVACPSMSVEALAMVPMNPKTRRTELGQRRTRRPFSVSEVEALVEAVETLGTGRWRDVKLRAFDNADHRTYVDLKDKWKTLVHTASIAPQQRRGQPVPQELLDRVLSAHAYWSQHQTKQHLKNQIEPPKSSETQVGRVGV